MESRINIVEISNALKKLIEKKILSEDHSSIIVYNLNMIYDKIQHIKKIFPKDTLHAVAVKANPLVKILNRIKEHNIGLETASLPELYMAKKIGYEHANIVFDSPSKTYEELNFALKLGVYINADSFEELNRIDSLIKKNNSKSKIGLRINPQIGTGKIKNTSVAGKISKFGIPINEHREEIIQKYLNFNWLNGIHVHIGSQGISIEQLIKGLEIVYQLALEIDDKLFKLNRKLDFFDIGGGFPVSYHKNIKPLAIEEYTNSIKSTFPKLFSNNFKIITEFGRFIYANSAFAISRVEYVKIEKDYKILSIHLGADFLLRKAYNPNDWHHEISILDKNGNLKTGTDSTKYIVAGPLCFAGDIIAKNINLPVVNEGDYLIIHDIGAYTLSMWSRYNSRQIPLILGYEDDNYNFEIIKTRETLDNLYDFWT